MKLKSTLIAASLLPLISMMSFAAPAMAGGGDFEGGSVSITKGGRTVIRVETDNGSIIQIAVGKDGSTSVANESADGDSTTTNTNREGDQQTHSTNKDKNGNGK